MNETPHFSIYIMWGYSCPFPIAKQVTTLHISILFIVNELSCKIYRQGMELHLSFASLVDESYIFAYILTGEKKLIGSHVTSCDTLSSGNNDAEGVSLKKWVDPSFIILVIVLVPRIRFSLRKWDRPCDPTSAIFYSPSSLPSLFVNVVTVSATK